MTFGERLKQLRKRDDLTQTEFAEKMEVTKGTVSTWETNRRRPSFETLCDLTNFFHVKMDYLLGNSDDNSTNKWKEEELAISQVEEDLKEYALKYARLDMYGKRAVEAIIRAEYDRCRSEKTLRSADDVKVRVILK